MRPSKLEARLTAETLLCLSRRPHLQLAAAHRPHLRRLTAVDLVHQRLPQHQQPAGKGGHREQSVVGAG